MSTSIIAIRIDWLALFNHMRWKIPWTNQSLQSITRTCKLKIIKFSTSKQVLIRDMKITPSDFVSSSVIQVHRINTIMQPKMESDPPSSNLHSDATQRQNSSIVDPKDEEHATKNSPSSEICRFPAFSASIPSSPPLAVPRPSQPSEVHQAFQNPSNLPKHSVLNSMATEIVILEFHCGFSMKGDLRDTFASKIYKIVEARKALATQAEPDFCQRRLCERRREWTLHFGEYRYAFGDDMDREIRFMLETIGKQWEEMGGGAEASGGGAGGRRYRRRGGQG